MGGSQSSRKITVENADAANVIKISDSVANRLSGSHRESPVSESQPAQPQQPPQSNYTPPVSDLRQPGQNFTPAPYFYQPSLTALDIQKQKEAQLKSNDIYWQKRVAELEISHHKIDQIMQEEYDRAVDDVKKRFQSLPPSQQLPPCQEGKQKLIACYQMNPKKPMMCAKEVQEFAQCVDMKRASIIANRA